MSSITAAQKWVFESELFESEHDMAIARLGFEAGWDAAQAQQVDTQNSGDPGRDITVAAAEPSRPEKGTEGVPKQRPASAEDKSGKVHPAPSVLNSVSEPEAQLLTCKKCGVESRRIAFGVCPECLQSKPGTSDG
jgi:hypothetical protein